MKKFILVAILTLSFNLFASLNTSVSVSKNEANLGDKVTVEIKAITNENKDITFELNLLDDKSFNVSEPKKSVENLPDNYKMTKLTFNIYPFEIKEIKPGKVKIIKGKEKIEKEIPTINVVSVFKSGNEKKEINPLKGQLDINPDYKHLYKYIAYTLIGIVILIIFIFLLKKYLKKIKNKEEVEEEIILDPPCDEVKKLLSSLLSSTLLKEGKVKEFFVELSEIAKRFLGRSFDFDYLYLTTEEVLSSVEKHVNMTEKMQLRDFFEQCDLVKFAKFIPEQGEINQTVNVLYKIVEMICERLKKEEEKNVQV